MTWLSEALSALQMTEEAEGYLLGRGAKTETYEDFGEGVWVGSPNPCPDSVFVERFGAHGEKIAGYLTCALWTPRGDPLGFEARKFKGGKRVIRYLDFPRAYYIPAWLTRRDTAAKLWAGGAAWIVEGRFDLYPLEWAIPPEDAVLASGRAMLTFRHVEYLRRFGCPVKFAYDNDETGESGYEKAKGWLERSGLDVERIPYRGKDPGTVWDNHGLDGMRRYFQPGYEG